MVEGIERCGVAEFLRVAASGGWVIEHVSVLVLVIQIHEQHGHGYQVVSLSSYLLRGTESGYLFCVLYRMLFGHVTGVHILVCVCVPW